MGSEREMFGGWARVALDLMRMLAGSFVFSGSVFVAFCWRV